MGAVSWRSFLAEPQPFFCGGVRGVAKIPTGRRGGGRESCREEREDAVRSFLPPFLLLDLCPSGSKTI